MLKYSKDKFLALADTRKAQVILQELHALESAWAGGADFAEVKSYLSWLGEESELYRLQALGAGLDLNTTKRQLLNVIVPVERYLSKNLKDDDLDIQTTDFKNANIKQYPLSVVLDHLRSSFNVGSIFRTAECLGVSHVYLVGYTPTPEDAGVKKTAMGADELVSWSQHDQMSEVLELLAQQQTPVIALETSEQAQNLEDFQCPARAAIVLGNERFGLEAELISKVDHLLKIPMSGQKNSLNVASTFSIVSYELCKQIKSQGGGQ